MRGQLRNLRLCEQVVGGAQCGKTAFVRAIAAFSENAVLDDSLSAGQSGVAVHVIPAVSRGALLEDERKGGCSLGLGVGLGWDGWGVHVWDGNLQCWACTVCMV